ncbi:MAG: hypothetical protein ACRCXZ_03760 [Patescibacteria group bacterium]
MKLLNLDFGQTCPKNAKTVVIFGFTSLFFHFKHYDCDLIFELVDYIDSIQRTYNCELEWNANGLIDEKYRILVVQLKRTNTFELVSTIQIDFRSKKAVWDYDQKQKYLITALLPVGSFFQLHSDKSTFLTLNGLDSYNFFDSFILDYCKNNRFYPVLKSGRPYIFDAFTLDMIPIESDNLIEIKTNTSNPDYYFFELDWFGFRILDTYGDRVRVNNQDVFVHFIEDSSQILQYSVLFIDTKLCVVCFNNNYCTVINFFNSKGIVKYTLPKNTPIGTIEKCYPDSSIRIKSIQIGKNNISLESLYDLSQNDFQKLF